MHLNVLFELRTLSKRVNTQVKARGESFQTTAHLSPAVSVRASTHTDTHAPTHTQRGEKMSRLLHFGLQAKFETKSIALHWVIKLWPRHASICGKHGDRFFHAAQLSLYLQMVQLGRNVTFDLVSFTERASQRRVFLPACLPAAPDKRAHDCLRGEDWFNTI